MAQSNYATLIGSLGVLLLLIAFGCNLFGLMGAKRYPYLLLNLVGALLACYSSYLINFIPFVVLEAIWAMVAAVNLGRLVLGRLS